MAFSINRATLLGNATKDAELKYTKNGKAVCTFSMATNRSIKDGDAWKDLPTFHRVIVWDKLAENASRNVKKGSKVVVEGRIDNRSYDDNGVTKYISEVVADTCITFISEKIGEQKSEEEKVFTTDEVADSVPF